jgi:tRNA (guanine37-N1)-methyltransferase
MTLRVHCVTVLPEMFSALTQHGVVGRAFERGLVSLTCWNPRDFTVDNYHRIDDRPYGGGPGMVMMPGPLEKTLAAIALGAGKAGLRLLTMSPQGRRLDHAFMTATLGNYEGGLPRPDLVIICGRYEGIDQRFLDRHPIEEISIGDFVVSGGELPAMLLLDALIRLLPGALNDEQSAQADSFVDGLLDCPHYTRPEVWEGQPVPEVLLSGNHARISAWRREQSLQQTQKKRPDLLVQALEKGLLNQVDRAFLAQLARKLP